MEVVHELKYTVFRWYGTVWALGWGYPGKTKLDAIKIAVTASRYRRVTEDKVESRKGSISCCMRIFHHRCRFGCRHVASVLVGHVFRSS